MKISKESAEHYNWGQQCDGWHLVKTDTLSVIQERMPSGTFEALHFHQKAQQFFYILSGTATFEIEGDEFSINASEGYHIKPGIKHKISNKGSVDLHFLVISEPKAHGDRINV